jgi:hypothetical protein
LGTSFVGKGEFSNVSASIAVDIFRGNIFGWFGNINLAVRSEWKMMV